jgi:hypothetical protein
MQMLSHIEQVWPGCKGTCSPRSKQGAQRAANEGREYSEDGGDGEYDEDGEFGCTLLMAGGNPHGSKVGDLEEES